MGGFESILKPFIDDVKKLAEVTPNSKLILGAKLDLFSSTVTNGFTIRTTVASIAIFCRKECMSADMIE